MSTARKAFIALFVILSGLLPTAKAWCQEPCRRVVVIYLDVSGSMYDGRFRSESYWSNHRQLTLMENTVRFLEKCLLAPGSQAVRPGDRLILRGFYARVAPLCNSIASYAPEVDAPRLGREIDQRLDFNQNHRYDLGDAKPELHHFKFKNSFLDDPRRLVTDFSGLVQDMIQLRQSTPLSTGGEQDFDQLLFIVLTDGGHDNEDTLGLFKEKIAEAGTLMAGDIARGRVQVHLYGLVAANRGAFRELSQVQDVSGDFASHLKASLGLLDLTLADQEWVNQRFASKAERVEIIGAGPARYQAPLPEPTVPEGQAGQAPAPRVLLPLTVQNHSCRSQELKEVHCVLFKSGPQGSTAWVKVDSRPLAVGRRLESRPSGHNVLELPLVYQTSLEPGAYELELTAMTSGLGAGLGPATRLALEVPPPPPPPAPPANYNRALLLAFLMLAALGGLVWLFLRNRSGRGPRQ